MEIFVMKNKDKTTRIAFIVEEGFNYFMTLFVTGTLLGYLLDTIGFSDALQGIISTVSTFACGAQLFALFLNGRRKKGIVVIGTFINELAFALVYLLPIFNFSASLKTVFLLAFLIVGHIVSNAVTPSRLTWLMTSVPLESRGSFTAIKEMISLAGGIAVSLSFGRIADVFRSTDGMPTRPYYIICALALFLMAIIRTASLAVSSEKPLTEEKTEIRKIITKIAKNKVFIKVVGVGIIWNVASAFLASFLASYLREELAFSFTVIAVISTVSSISRIIMSPIFGRLADKYSFASSMTLAFGCAAFSFLAIVFTSPGTRWLYVLYSSVYGFSQAGINSGVINLIYDYVEPSDRAVAMGVKNALGGIVAFFVAVGAGLILSSIQAADGIVIFGTNLYAQQFLAIIAFAITLLLIAYMRLVIAPIKKVENLK